VQVFDNHEQGLALAGAQQQVLDSVQGALAALGRIERLPPRVIAGHVQERQQCRQTGNEGRVQGLQRLGKSGAECLAVGVFCEV